MFIVLSWWSKSLQAFTQWYSTWRQVAAVSMDTASAIHTSHLPRKGCQMHCAIIIIWYYYPPQRLVLFLWKQRFYGLQFFSIWKLTLADSISYKTRSSPLWWSGCSTTLHTAGRMQGRQFTWDLTIDSVRINVNLNFILHWITVMFTNWRHDIATSYTARCKYWQRLKCSLSDWLETRSKLRSYLIYSSWT